MASWPSLTFLAFELMPFVICHASTRPCVIRVSSSRSCGVRDHLQQRGREFIKERRHRSKRIGQVKLGKTNIIEVSGIAGTGGCSLPVGLCPPRVNSSW